MKAQNKAFSITTETEGLISIVMPAYKCERYISKAIESEKKQKQREKEQKQLEKIRQSKIEIE